MQRASKLFLIEEAVIDSPFVEKIWRTRSAPSESFISIAVNHSEIVVTRQEGRTYVNVRGPETKATSLPIPQNAEFLGIQFRAGAFMPILPMEDLVDRSVTLPVASSKTFWLNSSAIEVPEYQDLEAFVERLVRGGHLVREPLVELALHGPVKDVSRRSVQRRFRRATGLTQAAFRQIQRAHKAVELLDQGVSILDTVHQAGYADQAHMTRSLKRLFGQTPAQIIGQQRDG
jgi:hypothetical protein